MFTSLKIQLRGSLRRKILLILVSVGVIPLIVLGAMAILSLNTSHDNDILSIEDNLLNQKIEETERYITEIASALQLQVGFEQISEIELAQQYFLLRGLLDEFPALSEVAFLNLDGQETARQGRTTGEVSPDELENLRSTKKFTFAKEGNRYFGEVYFTLLGPMMTVSAPVLNRNGIVVSVLTGEVSLSGLSRILRQSKLGKSGYVYLVDPDGFLVAHSQQEKETQKSLRRISFIGGVLGNDKSALMHTRYRSFWGEDVVSAGRAMSSLGLNIIAEWPAQDADGIVRTVRNQTVAATILVLAATLLASILFANQIIRPIKTLETGARLVAQGKFDQPVSITTGDEIEELGKTFNGMIAGLKRLEELKDEFVFIAAHELKTPVTVIKGYLTMIVDGTIGTVSEPVKEVMHEVIAANQRLVQLVNDLLQVARADADRLKIQALPLDISSIIEQVQKELKLLADEKSIRLSYEKLEKIPQVLADANPLKEVFANLIGNAIKYTRDNGTVSIWHEVADNMLVTHITDTGIGISADAQKKLFEKFYRVQTEETKDISGTGLGLFIVRQIIEKMGGTIRVESQEGKGSTFSFTLRLAPAAAG